MPQVSVAKTPSYEPEKMKEAVRLHFERLRLSSLIRPDMKIVLKPNLIMKRRPEDATTTHPELVRAVIGELENLGCEQIIVADSPGGLYTSGALKGIYDTCGMTRATENTAAKLNLEVGSREISGNGQITRRFTIIDPVAEADLVINLVKLKTHCMTVLSGAVKNLLGCVPGLMKPELHMRYPEKEPFAQMLLDLSLTVKPAISFVDAVDAMEGDGPTGGQKKHCGLTLCSTDLYALDLVNTAILGFDPIEIPTVRLAAQRGLSSLNLDDIAILGDGEALTAAGRFVYPKSKQADFSSQFPLWLRPAAQKIARRFGPRPMILKKSCIGCGKCAESCPAKVIEIKNNRAVIDPAGCIRCFCCHEMCPKQSVAIRRFRFFNL